MSPRCWSADNQPVQPGQVLVRIDPASIQARLAQAEANAQALEAGVAPGGRQGAAWNRR